MLFKTLSGWSKCSPILVRALPGKALGAILPLLLAGALGGCGQQGALYIPTEPAAANRATLPQTLRPGTRATPAAPAASQSPRSPPNSPPGSPPSSPPSPLPAQ